MTLNLGTLQAEVAVDTAKAEKALESLTRNMTQLEKQSDALKKSPLRVDVEKAKGADEAVRQMDKLKSAMEKVSGTSAKVDVKADTGAVDGALDKAAAKTRAFKDKADRDTTVKPTVDDAPLQAGLDGAMRKITGWAAAAGAAFSAANFASSVVQTGMEFQSQLNTLKAVSNATGEELAAVTNRARELGSATDLTATSASDAAGAMTELAKGGFTIQQSMDAAKGTLQLAAAAQVDAAQAATIQSQALQSFGLNASEAARVSDILAGAANASSAEMTGIAQGMAQAGTVSKQFGLTVDDTATALAMFANAGIQGSDAGTLLKSALISLTDQGNPAQQAIEDLGLTVYDAQGNFVGLSSLMGQLKKAAAEMTPEQYQAATAVLFGTDAMRMAGIAAEKGAEGFDTLKAAVTRQGQAAEVAAAQTEGLPGAWERFQNTMEDLKLGVFAAVQDELVDAANSGVDALDSLAPAIEGAASTAASGANALMGMVNAATDLPDPVKELGGDFVKLGLALAALNSSPVTGLFEKLGDGASNAKASVADFWGKMNTAMVEASANYQAQAGMLRMTAAEHRALAAAATTARTASVEASLAMDAQWGASVASMQAKTAALGAGMRTMTSTAKAGMGNLVNALGGPLNLALAGGTVAITELWRANKAAKEAQDNMARSALDAADAQDVLKLAVAGTTGALSAEGLEAATTIANSNLADVTMLGKEYAKALHVVQSETTLIQRASLWGEGKAQWESEKQRAGELGDAYKALKKATGEMGVSMEAVGGIVAQAGPQYDELQQKLRSLGPDGEAMARELGLARDELEGMEQAARRLSPGMADIGNALNILGDNAASAEQKIASMKRLMDVMSGGTMGTQEAMMHLADTVSQVNDEVAKLDESKGIGSGLFTDDGLLNSRVDNARQLHSELTQLQDAFLIAGRSGMDLEVAYNEQLGPAIEGIAERYQLSAEQVENLREQFQLMPETVQTLVSLEGADESVQDMSEVWALLEKAKDTGETTFTVDAMTEDAARNLEALGIHAEQLDDGNWKVTVDGDVDAAREGLQSVLSFADEAANKNIAIEALLNTDQLEGSAANAQALLDTLDIANPTPQADLIIQKLLSGVDISHGELAALAAESARPTADLENNLLISKALASRVEVQSVDGMHAQTTADLTDNASGKARGIKGALDAIPRFVKTVVETVTRTGHADKSGPTGGAYGGSSGYYLGGQIPRLAAGDLTHGGYRLPLTGPGTHTTDGILGLDAVGIPTAWVDRGEFVTNRAATEKYLGLLQAVNADNPAAIFAEALAGVKKLAAGGTTGTSAPAPAIGATTAAAPGTTVTAETGDALTDLTTVEQKLATVAEGAEAIVTADTDKAEGNLATLRTALDAAVGTHKLGLEADTSGPEAQLATLGETLGALTEEMHPVTVDVDAETLGQEVALAQEALARLEETPATATAGLDAAPLDQGADEARSNLDDLAGQTPVPVADLDNDPLMSGVAAADAELNRVGAAKSTSVADVDNSSALANIQGVINELNRMPVERVIKVVAHGTTGLFKGGEVPGLADGGSIAGTALPTSGPGTATIDGFLGIDGKGMPLVRVNRGEYVVNDRSTREYRREIEMINAGTFPKLDNLDMLAAGAQTAPGLFKGGVVSPDQLLAFARGKTTRGVTPPGPLEGSPYIWGGGLLGNWGDCSGAMSGLAALAVGMDVNGRKFATMNQGQVLSAMGFRPGIGPSGTSFNLGWFNGGPAGGHTAGTIGGTNVEMGGGRGNGQVGGPAAGATHPQFTDHAWLPLGELVAFDYYRALANVTARRQPAGRGGYSPTGGLGVGLGGLGVGPGGAGVTLHDKGGWHQPGTFAYNGLTEPEPILSPDTWRLVEQMIAVFPQAADVWVQAGQSLERAAEQLTRVSDKPAETAEAWRGLMGGKFEYDNIVGAMNGAPLAGLGITGRDVLGGDLSAQLENLAQNAGAGAEATGALNSELMVNLAMSDQTIRAYQELEKAKEADQKAADDIREAEEKLAEAHEKASDATADNAKAVRDAQEQLDQARANAAKAKPEDSEEAARKVRDAEEKLTEAREKGAGKAGDTSQAIADAEEQLAKARADKVASAAVLVSAQFGLQVAAVMGALELLGSVTDRISSAVVGGFEGAASGAALLADSIGRLAENMETAAKITDDHAAAQDSAINAAIKLQQAVEAQREVERRARTDAQQGVRDTQAAEFDLRMTRWEAAQTAGVAEADLQAAREKGIFDVFALATEADRKAMKSASDVLVSEARLAAVRARADQQDYENTLAVTAANNELELAQVLAGLEMDKLTAASYALAKAQAYAAGELGGATALERYIAGVQKVAEAEAKRAAGTATSVGAWLNPLRWFKGDTMKGAGMGSEADALAMEGQAIMDAYRDLMQGDLARLNTEDRAAAERAIAELTNAATHMKMGGAGVYSVITGDGGEAVKITAEMAMRKATAELDRLMLKSKYGMEASQLEADRQVTAIDRQQRLAEMQAKQAELAQTLESWVKRDSLAELVALTEQQLAEHEQENKQLGGISGKLDDRKVSTIMSIGGSGWGAATAGPAFDGGFGGVRAGDLSLWESARMENGWLDREIARALLPAADTLADAAAAAGQYPTGLPDTVVDGYYRGPVEGSATALRDAATRSAAELEANTQALRDLSQAIASAPLAPSVGTQYTGPVTVQSTGATRIAEDLSSALTRG